MARLADLQVLWLRPPQILTSTVTHNHPQGPTLASCRYWQRVVGKVGETRPFLPKGRLQDVQRPQSFGPADSPGWGRPS